MYKFSCPHCGHTTRRKTHGEGHCKGCGTKYWMEHSKVSWAPFNRDEKNERKARENDSSD